MQILVEGTISPWLFSGSSFYLGSLIDPGIFSPPGTVLTGNPIQILWFDNPVTAAITINGVTVTLGPVNGVYLPSAFVTPTFQNITVCDCGYSIAVDSYDSLTAATKPNGLGGSLELIGPNNQPLDGYFYVDGPVGVPSPIVGSGLISLLIGITLWRLYARQT